MMERRPGWDPDDFGYDRVINGGRGLKTVRQDLESEPVPSGRREREYCLPSILPDADLSVLEYLEGGDVMRRRTELREGWSWNNDEEVLKANYGQGGISGWER